MCTNTLRKVYESLRSAIDMPVRFVRKPFWPTHLQFRAFGVSVVACNPTLASAERRALSLTVFG